MNQTQRAILEEMRQHQIVTAGELAQILDRTSADIRHHINGLLDEGWIIKEVDQPGSGRGRPSHRYRLGSRAKKEYYLPLFKAFVEECILPLTAEEQRTALLRLASNLAGNNALASASLTLNLTRAVNRLNELGYRARWEARADSPWIYLEYSPYQILFIELSIFKFFDATLLEALLHRPVNRITGGKNKEIDIYMMK